MLEQTLLSINYDLLFEINYDKKKTNRFYQRNFFIKS